MGSAVMRGVVLFAAAAVACGAASAAITENVTASLPRGLYVRSFAAVEHSPFAMFPLPENMRAFFAARGDGGFFDNPRHGFLKRVAAVAGDEVCSDGRTVRINGRQVGDIRTDIPRQELLPRWEGCRVIAESEFFPMADAPGSIDGRFYGPVSTTSARGYRELVRY